MISKDTTQIYDPDCSTCAHRVERHPEINPAWWAVIALYAMSDRFKRVYEQSAKQAEEYGWFRKESESCPHLVVEQNGNAYERICHHPSRYDPSEWCTCEKGECPLRHGFGRIS